MFRKVATTVPVPGEPAMRAQIVRGWIGDVPYRSYTAALLVSIEVAVILTMAGIDHGLKGASSPGQLQFALLAIALLLFVALVGFSFLAIERYFCVAEKTQDLGVLKVLGASRSYIAGVLLIETLAICVPGFVAGVGVTFLGRWGTALAFPRLLRVDVVLLSWPIAFAIAALGSMLGGILGARKAIRDGVVQALSYEP